MSKILSVSYFLLASSLFIYSYGFVDFNLTLSSNLYVSKFVAWSQQLAMFNRSTSFYVYVGIVIALYLLYFGVIVHWFKHKLLKFPWKIVAAIAVIFSLSYPLLSSDVFKYLFSAKTVLVYHANPHLFAPQIFVGDPWLRFMRWIHTPSPYGPVMTALAIPYYLLGLGKFVPSLYLFKLDQLFWYGLAIWVIGKLAHKRPVLAQLIFALNPLVLIEWLVNAHNDAPMISLLLLSFYFLSLGKRLPAFISLLFSIGIKYVTIFFLPVIFLYQKFHPLTIIHYSLIALITAPLIYNYQTQFQPWYVTWLVPFAALSGSIPLMGIVTAYTLGALLRYTPFIQTGLWQGSGRYFAILTFTPLIFAIIYFLILKLFKRFHT